MSFWPFGQNANSASHLNRLLDEYYYERSNASQQQSSTNAQPSEVDPSFASASTTHNAATSSNNQDTSAIAGSSSNVTPGLDQEKENIKIDKEFVYDLLDDPSFLNELSRQNNKLIDFICFGYIDKEDDEDEGGDESGVDQDNDVDMNDDDNDNTKQQKQQTQSTQGKSILEVLLDLVVDSEQWFEENEQQLYQASENQLDEDETTANDITTTFNRIHTASEVLSCKIWLISENLVEEPQLLNKLWWFLKNDFKSSSPSIQFFIKINEQLLESRPDQMLNFIRSLQDLVDLFLKHVNITMIMDFLLRIITTDKADNPTGIIELLSEQKLIPKLLNLLYPDHDSSIQSSCGDFLKALIAISANTSIDENTIGPNLLTKELVSDTCIDKIIEIMLLKGNGLATVVGVIIEIIRKNNSDYDSVNLLYTTTESNPPNKRDPIYLGNMLKKFAQKLGSFNDILTDKELTSKRIETQINQEIEPLGFERFKICELVAELLHCSNIALLNNHLTEKIIEERENFLEQQEFNLKNALSEDLINSNNTKHSASPSPGANSYNGSTFSNLNIGGTSEPSVALSSKHITISPHSTPSIDPMTSITEADEDVKSQEDGSSGSHHHQLPQLHIPVVTKKEQLRSNPTVGDVFKIALIDSNVLTTIIDMFVKFPWNNFWHNVVFDIVQQIFNGRLDISYNPYLILELFDKCDITNLIINAYKLCIDTEREANVRLGYMGHLILIAEEVVKFSSTFQNSKFNDTEADELIYTKLIDENWISYVTNVLTETREMYNCVLGGIKANEFSEGDYINHNTIVLGNSEEEILNQQTEDGGPPDEMFYDSKETEEDEEEEEEDKEMA